MTKNNIDFSIVIVSYNTEILLKKCLESIFKQTKDIKFEVIVVDNGSKDGSLRFLKNFSKKHNIKIIENNKNLGFAKANNIGIKRSVGSYVALLNSDTELKNNLFKTMCKWLRKRPQVGAATCKLIYPNGKIQSAGGNFPNLINVFSWMTIQDLPIVDRVIKPFQPLKEMSPLKNDALYETPSDLEWIAGAFFIIKNEAIKSVGLLDEDYFMYTEDVDYCFRLMKGGWEVAYNPECELIHHKGASGTSEFAVTKEFEGIKLFFRKHRPKWQLPLVRLFLQIGAIGRVILFFLLGRKTLSKIYANSYKTI